jgi:heptosyltransferase-1
MTTLRVDPASVRRVLVVRPRFIGDICLTLPVIDALRAAAPHARIGYLTEASCAPLLEGDPRLDTLLAAPPRPGAGATLSLVAAIRQFAPDVVLDLFCNPRTAVWTRLSGARVRIGYPGKGWRSGMYTHHVRPRTLSAVGFHLASVAALGWPAPHGTPRLHVSDALRQAARTALGARGVPAGARLVGMHPGARWPTRRWALENYVALARRIVARHDDVTVLFTGGPGEQAMVEEAAGAVTGAVAVTGLPIRDFVHLQAACTAFVCGDTGPVHTGVAVGCPTLGLFSRNRPAMFFPYPESEGHRAYYARVECSPCHRDECPDVRCLRRLTVDGAFDRLSAMLAPQRASLGA